MIPRWDEAVPCPLVLTGPDAETNLLRDRRVEWGGQLENSAFNVDGVCGAAPVLIAF